jgi:dephospho-CoA kinase
LVGPLIVVVVGNAVFSDEAKLKRLNEITHPIIEKVIFDKIREYNGSIVFLVVPLLFEAGYDKYCDYIVSVISSESERIERLKKRNNTVTDEAARGIINAQTDDEQTKARSNEVIVNDGSLSDLEAKVTEFYHKIIKMSAK